MATLPEGRSPVLRLPARRAELNTGGSIFGGWIMSIVDIAGSEPAYLRAEGPVVTRAVESLEFKQPVFAGDMVSCYAEVVDTGGTSVTVDVEVYAERTEMGAVDVIKVTEAKLVYVAIDGKRKPRRLPQR